MKSTHSIHPSLLKVAVAVSIAVGTLGSAQAATTINPDTDRLIVKYMDSGSGVF